MGDLFDNFFTRIGTAMNGGKSHPHYSGSSQVNAGPFYNYHSSATNNKYWLPRSDMRNTLDKLDDTNNTLRQNSVGSYESMDGERSRNNSVTSENLE